MDELINHMENRAERIKLLLSADFECLSEFINRDMCRGALQELMNLIVFSKVLRKGNEQ